MLCSHMLLASMHRGKSPHEPAALADLKLRTGRAGWQKRGGGSPPRRRMPGIVARLHKHLLRTQRHTQFQRYGVANSAATGPTPKLSGDAWA